jgi:hypothetical protein
MTHEEIINGNKLIAAFMGAEIRDVKHHGIRQGERCYYMGDYRPSYDGIHIEELKYHSSFNWLMPVVEKIKHLPIKDAYGVSFHVQNDCIWFGVDNQKEKGLNQHQKGSFIISLWSACIEFINWYNQQ